MPYIISKKADLLVILNIKSTFYIKQKLSTLCNNTNHFLYLKIQLFE